MISNYGQATGGAFVSTNVELGIYRHLSDVLDVTVKVKLMDEVVLNDKVKREADRLLAHIVRADSMIVAVKAGARADGFVLGMQMAGGLRVGDAEQLHIIFESALEKRLKTLSSI